MPICADLSALELKRRARARQQNFYPLKAAQTMAAVETVLAWHTRRTWLRFRYANWAAG
jgi:hypothetical protein